MNKKDRIALVCSLLLLILGINETEGLAAVLFLITCYWGYRFVKNDISFLHIKNE